MLPHGSLHTNTNRYEIHLRTKHERSGLDQKRTPPPPPTHDSILIFFLKIYTFIFSFTGELCGSGHVHRFALQVSSLV
jgi:hypothetical protein